MYVCVCVCVVPQLQTIRNRFSIHTCSSCKPIEHVTITCVYVYDVCVGVCMHVLECVHICVGECESM